MMLQHNSSKRWERNTPFFFIPILFLFFLPVHIFADSNKVHFDAEALLPENQQSEASYYDLKVKPGEEQSLVFKLKNTSDEPVNVIVEANKATTNKNGAIDYSKHDVKILGTPSFEELVSKSQEVTLKPKEEREVTFQLKVPDKGFKGTVLGGFYCYENLKGKEGDNGGFQLRNRFAYTIGAKLVCTDADIIPDIRLTGVVPGLDDGYLAMIATLENPEPVLMSKLKMKATIIEKKGKKVLHEFHRKLSFAPQTKVDFPLSLNNEPLKKGKYELQMVIQNDKGKKWNLQKEFEVKDEDKKLNKKAVEVKESKNNDFVYPMLLTLFLIVILSLIYYIYRLKHKKE